MGYVSCINRSVFSLAWALALRIPTAADSLVLLTVLENLKLGSLESTAM